MRFSFLKVAVCVSLILWGSIYLGCAGENIKDQDKELYEQIAIFRCRYNYPIGLRRRSGAEETCVWSA